ncbi:hypothetical protein B0H16DRAFT_802385 [Mycena metata]|uniref:Uncharacterized protein n=1 Tax=Mycena metata TaxID=1033252 RepID=A0AAD7K5S9_9AGAR|nr:hypothetical protein B0H16DRAFT_802385 [Mycena metata]
MAGPPPILMRVASCSVVYHISVHGRQKGRCCGASSTSVLPRTACKAFFAVSCCKACCRTCVAYSIKYFHWQSTISPSSKNMRLSFPSQGRKPSTSTAKLKPPSANPRVTTFFAKLRPPFARGTKALPDIISTSLVALKESADAFPPLKSAVGGVLAVWDVAQRAKHSKADAHAIALRTQTILDMMADALPDPSAIPPAMLSSIERFTLLLDEICTSMEVLTRSSGVFRLANLNCNERLLQEIKDQLDEAYRDFQVASTLRIEAQQAALVVSQADQHFQTRIAVQTMAVSPQNLLRRLTYLFRIPWRTASPRFCFTPNFSFFYPAPENAIVLLSGFLSLYL